MLSVAALLAAGCSPRHGSERLSIERIEEVYHTGSGRCEAVAVVRNDSRSRIGLLEARATLFVGERVAARAVAAGRTEVAAKRTERVVLPFYVRVTDEPRSAAALERLRSGDVEGMRIDVEAVVSAGGIRRKVVFSCEKERLSEILAIFGDDISAGSGD